MENLQDRYPINTIINLPGPDPRGVVTGYRGGLLLVFVLASDEGTIEVDPQELGQTWRGW